MAQPPAVVIIARHGARLDAADSSWHLSTPTPYDPPLTYGGWNQCRALGVRIASLLNARELSFNDATSEPPAPSGTRSRDFARVDGADGGEGRKVSRKRKRKHRVVVHSSPFLRCLQTSIAIAAGMRQYQPAIEPSGNRTGKAPNQKHSGSSEQASEHSRNRQRKSKLRVDAFLGEWLNPGYFDHITPPPPSAMMVPTAKAELMLNEAIDVYTPTTSSKASSGSLWDGANGTRTPSKESTLDDWSHTREPLPAPSPRRDRASTVDIVDSLESMHSSGRKSPFRPGHVLQPFTSTLPNQEATNYVPPTPSYAVSPADQIPRGYLAHARNACVGVDYQWDSCRPPQDWGNGGEYGEEWSAMHKRFRRGLNRMIHWYSQHGPDDRAEDALGIEQAEREDSRPEDEEQEDLVVVLVTHGAGCNALIGALTGQPVLLDVGMASLTMAVRKDDAPTLPLLPLSPAPSVDSSAPPSTSTTPRDSPQPPSFFVQDVNGHAHSYNRQTSITGKEVRLSDVYDMKLVSSSEHLRPGADPTKVSNNATAGRGGIVKRETLHRVKMQHNTLNPDAAHVAAGAPLVASGNLGERNPDGGGGSTNASLGTMRLPSTANTAASALNHPTTSEMTAALPVTPPFTPGLWTPPASKTPLLQSELGKNEKISVFSTWGQNGGRVSPGDDLVLDFSNSPPESRPGTSGGTGSSQPLSLANGGSLDCPLDSRTNGTSGLHGEYIEDDDEIADLPRPGDKLPQALSRGLSQKGLWGTRPTGDTVRRVFPAEEGKRRWSVHPTE